MGSLFKWLNHQKLKAAQFQQSSQELTDGMEFLGLCVFLLENWKHEKGGTNIVTLWEVLCVLMGQY